MEGLLHSALMYIRYIGKFYLNSYGCRIIFFGDYGVAVISSNAKIEIIYLCE